MENKTFEEKLARLEEIVKALEKDSLTLKESISLYQEGKTISQNLNKELNDSMNKLSFIVEDDEVKTYSEEESQDKDI